MNTKSKLPLVASFVMLLLLLFFARVAAPVRAQDSGWKEYVLPDEYSLLGIRFFGEDHGRAWGMKHDGSDWFPFIFETSDGGVNWMEETDALKNLKRWSKTSSIDISGINYFSDCRYSRAEDLYVITSDVFYAEAMVHCNSRIGGVPHESDDLDIFRTEDGGKTWSRVIMTDDILDGEITDIIPVSDGGIWIILYDNISLVQQFLFSSDGIRFGPRFISDLPSNAIKDLEFPRPDFGYVEVYLSSINEMRYRYSVRSTRDGGAIWTSLPPLPELQFTELFDFFFFDENHGWAAASASTEVGYQGMFLRTVDGGNTWEETLIPPPGENGIYTHFSIRFQDPYIGFGIGDYLQGDTGERQGILYMSADGGTVWETILRRPFIGCIETTDTHVFVCADNSILRLELPSPRPTPMPTPTSTLTPVFPTKTPIPLPTVAPVPDPNIRCFSIPVLFLFMVFLWWPLIRKL